jgi:hypothetical protein
MTKTVLLNNIEKEYQQEIEKLTQIGQSLTADNVIELSKKLHSDIKAKGISTNIHPDDMLLFQYGTYDWGGELGEHFKFDITRQFSKKNFDMFQLSLTLIFEPTTVESYNSWSMYFKTLDEWSDNIKTTEGYKLASTLMLKTHKLTFSKI